MKSKIYSFLIPLLLCCSICSAQIYVNLINPRQYELAGNTLNISAQVVSNYQISTVKASTPGRETSLTYDGVYFSGSLSLAGTRHGDTLNLQVTATDHLNNQQTVNQKIVYDVPPIINVDSPVNETVATPKIRLKLKCEDADSCTIQVMFPYVRFYNEVIFSTRIKDYLDTIVDLSAFNNISGDLRIIARDGRNQESAIDRFIHVNTNPYLEEYVTSDTKIIDFNYGKVLVYGQESMSYPGLIDVNTKQKTLIPFKVDIREYSQVTPYGVLIQGFDSSKRNISPPSSFLNSAYLYEYGGGTISGLGEIQPNYSLKQAGKYAGFSRGFRNFSARDMQTKKDTSFFTWSGDVAANGLVVFSEYYTSNLHTYKNGITTKLSDVGSFLLTDGTNITYYKGSSLYLFNGQSTIKIADSIPQVFSFMPLPSPRYPNSYQFKNKFVAYPKVGSSGQVQIWLYDSLGKNTQLSFFGDTAVVDLLTPRGDVVYYRARNHKFHSRYIRLRSGETYEISKLGTTYFYDSTFYVAIGRSLFKVNFKPCTINARFTYSGSTTAPAAMTFTNQTTPDSTGISYKWYFGTGDSSAAKNPVYTYSKPGTYTVRLTATTGLCVRSKDTTIIIKECIVEPRFTYSKDTVQSNNISFENKTESIFPILKYSWDFGDGSKDTSKNPLHIYSNAGSYNVCLQVTESGSCIKTYCSSVVVTLPAGRINVAPNPVQNSFNLYLNAEKAGTYTIRISNFSGLVAKEVKYTAVAGANYILINIADLAQGYYVVTADNQQEQLQFKILKL